MHGWNVTPQEAIAIQKELRDQVKLLPLRAPIHTIAGADVSLNRFGTDLYAGIIVLSYPDLLPLEHAVIKVKMEFPYIPGLLSFREIPGIVRCFGKLNIKPDVIMVDGQGIAHPRRLGIAAHLGVLLKVPTLGCGKSKLYGNYIEPTEVGEMQPIVDPKNKEIIGTAFKSKKNSKPLIISPGTLMTVHDAETMVRMTLRGYRLPEPTRQAHLLVNRFRTGEITE